MGNPILVVKDAGHGTTPACPQAKYHCGDVMRWGKLEAAIIGIVPPGFSAEYALADLLGEPRPLMIRREKRCVCYILAREGDPSPYLVAESRLRPTGQTVEIGTISREGQPWQL